jgi:hypothetical protein
MAIHISKTLRNKLPKDQRDNIEENLRTKANGTCFLCDGLFNEVSDDIEADHHIPSISGGLTDEQNLNLSHRSCNRSKQDHSTSQIKPYLKFQRFMGNLGRPVKYDGAIPHFQITPMLTRCLFKDETATFVFPGTTEKIEVPVYRDIHDGEPYEYCFSRIPRSAIYNDDDIQPRNIDSNHVKAIYFDILKIHCMNPPISELILNEIWSRTVPLSFSMGNTRQ